MEATKADIAKILTIISAAWPQFEPSAEKVNLWHEMLRDIPKQVLAVAVKRLIAERSFPPSISDIRKEASYLLDPDKQTPAEAWGVVQNAVRKYGFYRAVEGVSSLPPRIKKVVDCIGWTSLCTSDNISVLRGQFMKMYEQIQEEEAKERLMPKQLRREVLTGSQLKMIGGSVDEAQVD